MADYCEDFMCKYKIEYIFKDLEVDRTCWTTETSPLALYTATL